MVNRAALRVEHAGLQSDKDTDFHASGLLAGSLADTGPDMRAAIACMPRGAIASGQVVHRGRKHRSQVAECRIIVALLSHHFPICNLNATTASLVQ
jgi:hypothetical protein